MRKTIRAAGSRDLPDESSKVRMNGSQMAAERWLEENKGALESSNRYVEKNGLPLARHRQF